MITEIKLVYSAIKKVLAEKTYLLLALLVAAFFFSVFIFIPLVSIPGNYLRFQLSIYSRENYILMTSLALLIGVTFTTQIYAARKQRALRKSLPLVLQGGALSSASGIFGSIVGTASCASCLASLFGLIGLGTGSVFFVIDKQNYFLWGSILIMLISLYFAARKIDAVCTSC